MLNPNVLIAAIRRLTIHDGPGIRDTVFVKGCPLHCVWCHNPECISGKRQVIFHRKLCVNCGKCQAKCTQNVHSFDGTSKHLINRDNCLNCGKCAEHCLFNALEICGESMSVEEVFEKVFRDRDFFIPEGGVTLSGGEPAIYPEFAAELFKKLQSNSIHTALDTCGAVRFENYLQILPYTDLVLFDLKGMDPVRHKQNTGMDNTLIHENLKKISEYGTPVEIRMPIVPGCNDFAGDIEAAGRLLQQIKTVVKVRLLAYHPFSEEKYAAAGVVNYMPAVQPPDKKHLDRIANTLESLLPSDVPVVYS